jgi:hypothetical protein
VAPWCLQDIPGGIVNGLTCTLVSTELDGCGQPTSVRVRDDKGRGFEITRVRHTIELGDTGESVTRENFPLVPGYAATVHKIQGANISYPHMCDLLSVKRFPDTCAMRRALTTVMLSRATASEYQHLFAREVDEKGKYSARSLTQDQIVAHLRGVFQWRDTDPDYVAWMHMQDRNIFKTTVPSGE